MQNGGFGCHIQFWLKPKVNRSIFSRIILLSSISTLLLSYKINGRTVLYLQLIVEIQLEASKLGWKRRSIKRRRKMFYEEICKTFRRFITELKWMQRRSETKKIKSKECQRKDNTCSLQKKKSLKCSCIQWKSFAWRMKQPRPRLADEIIY